MSALGGKQTLQELCGRTDEPDYEISEPNEAHAENYEGSSSRKLTAVGYARRAITMEVEQPSGEQNGDERADERQAER
jgi:hypothetical protein